MIKLFFITSRVILGGYLETPIYIYILALTCRLKSTELCEPEVLKPVFKPIGFSCWSKVICRLTSQSADSATHRTTLKSFTK